MKTNEKNNTISLELPVYKLARKLAKAEGMTVEAFLETLVQERQKAAKKPVRITLSPEAHQFVSEVYQAAGLSVSDWLELNEEMHEREILRETFEGRHAGLTDSIVAYYDPDAATLAKIHKVIERWRGHLAVPA